MMGRPWGVTKVNCSTSFVLSTRSPRDHLVRKIDAVLDLCYGTERRSPSRSRNEIATNWVKRP